MAQIKKLQKGGAATVKDTPKTINYKGVTFDKDALITGYKDYLKTTAQNNMAGFQQADQYKDIDEHLNTRLSSLQNISIIDENKDFTTAPTTISGVTGLNVFLNKSDKSKSKQFENEAFYNYLDKSVELNQGQTATPTKDYHRFHSLTGSITSSDYGNKLDGFKIGWNKKTMDEKKARVRTALLDELSKLKGAEGKEIIGLDKDIITKLQQGDTDRYISEIPTADDKKLEEIADKLGLTSDLSELLYTAPKTQDELEKEKTLADWTAKNDKIKLENEITKANNKLIIAGNAKKREEAAAKLKALTKAKNDKLAAEKAAISGHATIGDIQNWKTEDSLEAAAISADVVSLAGGYVGLGAGLTATGLQLTADIMRDSSGLDIATNLGLNLGFTALALIPGVGGSVKASYKASKLAKAALEAAKIAKGADKILDEVKIAKEIVAASKVSGAVVDAKKVMRAEQLIESANTLKKSEKVAEKVIKTGLRKNWHLDPDKLGKIGKFTANTIRTGSVLQGLNVGSQAVMQTIEDVANSKESGLAKLGDITLNDVRGLTALAAGVKGAKQSIVGKFGTTETTTVTTAGKTKIKLKNAPEGTDKEIELPGNLKTKAEIDAALTKHFDTEIATKKQAIKDLNDKVTSAEGAKIKIEGEKLDAELKSLEAAKLAGANHGKLWGLTGYPKRAAGFGRTKDKTTSERTVKEVPDSNSPQWLQKYAINQASKEANKIKAALDEVGKYNSEYLKALRRTKVKENWDKRPKPQEVKEVKEVKAVIKQKDPIRKERKPLKEVSDEQKLLNKKNAMKFLQKKKEDRAKNKETAKKIKEWEIPFNMQGGILKYQTPAGPLEFLTTPTTGFPWEASVHKNDPLRGNPDNWIKRSSSLIYDYKEPATASTTTVEPEGKIPMITLPEITVIGNKRVPSTSNVFKAAPVIPQKTTLNLPNLAEPIKFLAGINTNNKNLQTILSHTTPVLKTPFQKVGQAVDWTTLQGAYNTEAANVQRVASKPMTSDASLMKASQFEGATAANKLRLEGAQKAWQVQGTNKQAAIELGNENAAARHTTAEENKTTISAYRSLVGNLIAGKRVQDYANFTKFVDASTKAITDRGILKHEYDISKQRQDILDEYENADWKKIQSIIQKEYGDSGENWRDSKEGIAFEAQQQSALPNEKISWESSSNPLYKEYTDRMNLISKQLTDKQKASWEVATLKGKAMNTFYDPTQIQVTLPKKFFLGKKPIQFKSGGSIGEKYQIEVLKSIQKNKDRDSKNYQKTLDRTDKSVSKILDGLSKEKLILLKTVLGIK